MPIFNEIFIHLFYDIFLTFSDKLYQLEGQHMMYKVQDYDDLQANMCLLISFLGLLSNCDKF